MGGFLPHALVPCTRYAQAREHFIATPFDNGVPTGAGPGPITDSDLRPLCDRLTRAVYIY